MTKLELVINLNSIHSIIILAYSKADFIRTIDEVHSYIVIHRVLTYVFRLPPSIFSFSIAVRRRCPPICDVLKYLTRVFAQLTRRLANRCDIMSCEIRLMQCAIHLTLMIDWCCVVTNSLAFRTFDPLSETIAAIFP